jgi:hypothetical protein
MAKCGFLTKTGGGTFPVGRGRKMGEPQGWWRIAVSSRVLRRLDGIRDEVKADTGEHLSYNSVINIFIKKYQSDKPH